MTEVNNKKLEKYFEKISEHHNSDTKNTGYEINDRSIFKNELLLNILGYELKNILDDVSQKVEKKTKTPDIRLYGESEAKDKNTHSQFVIETKNFGLLEHKIDNIDFKQLKNYIISNKTKIRVICSTDYVSLFVFNATKIKKQININSIDTISTQEINIFNDNLLYEIHFDNLKDRDASDLKNLAYDSVFTEHKFVTSTENEELYSIQDPNNKNNFISNLFKLMKIIESDVTHDFYDILNNFFDKFNSLTDDIDFKSYLIKKIVEDEFKVMKSFLIWGSEMNYIGDVITDPYTKISKDEAFDFFNNKDYQEAFILTSVYNLINKTFFIRILEDSATNNTTFINRYLSNGVLNRKIKEGEDALVQYLKSVFEFSQPDLKQFSFLLKKDIYSWILDWIDKPNLISFIRLFNDISFKKLNQDILGDIYEHYLEQDKTEDSSKSFRRLLGQYYTPKPIVRLMWYLVRDVLRKTKGRDLYHKNEPYLDILDPAYGSGTFLYEVILHINEAATKKPITKDGKVWAFIKERNKNSKIEDHLFGFEINPLSKSIADVNLFFGLIQAYGIDNLNDLQNLNLFRTNSLNLDLNELAKETPQTLLPFMTDDIKYSLEEKKEIVKAKKRKYDIIIANPPYGGIEPNEFMKNELIPFAYAENNYNSKCEEVSFSLTNKNKKNKVPKFEKNRGKLRDMYAFFFGLADNLLKEEGLFCFITSNTYLSAPTYKWIRKYWLENYTIHYLINFNTKGEKTNSMFAPEAGVATAIILLEKKKANENHEINYIDYSEINSIVGKYNKFCNIKWKDKPKNKNDIINFSLKSIGENNIKLIKQFDFLNNTDYIFNYNILQKKIEKNSIKLHEILLMKCGVVSADDTSVISKNKNELISLIQTKILKSSDFKLVKKTLRKHLLKQKENGIKFNDFNKNKIYKYLFERETFKYFITPNSYLYYDTEILFRPRKSEDILKKEKLIVYENKTKNTINACVIEDEIIIPKQNDRIHYYLSDDLDKLYFVSAILNSKVIEYFSKIILSASSQICPIKEILNNHEDYLKLVKFSKEIHKLKKDQYCLINNQNNFKSDWFNKNITPKIEIVSLLEGSELWEISFASEMVSDYYVSSAKIDENNKNEIILNSETKIICNNDKTAKKLLKNYLKNYDGNLSEEEIIINLTEFQDLQEFKSILETVENKCLEIENKIDDLVFKIYDIDENEKKTIIEELYEK